MGTTRKSTEDSRRRPKQDKATSNSSKSAGAKDSGLFAGVSQAPTTPKKGRKNTSRSRRVPDSPPLSDSPLHDFLEREDEEEVVEEDQQTYQTWNFTPIPPHGAQKSANGRNEGRSLIMWGRPRMIEKVMMHLQYECSRHKIELPWDAIAHRLHPGSTGGAVVQYMSRLRNQLIVEGHMVPPPMQKPGSRAPVDPWIRGYVRKDQDAKVVFKVGHEAFETRPVRFDEKLDDRHFNIPDAVDVLNSQSISSPARPKTKNGKRPATKSLSSPSKRIKRETIEIGPAHLPMDAEYKPASQAPPRRKAAARAALAIASKDSDSDSDPEDLEDEDRRSLDAPHEQVLHEIQEHLKLPAENLVETGRQENIDDHLAEDEDEDEERERYSGLYDSEYDEAASRRFAESIISPEFNRPLPYNGYVGLTVNFDDVDGEDHN